MSYYEIVRHDDCGRIIYSLDFNGHEKWYKYDDQGRLTYHRSPADNLDCWIVYDDENNITCTRYSDGEEWLTQKDSFGNTIHEKIIKHGKCIEEMWYKYNESGTKRIYWKDLEGTETWYDESGNIIHQIYDGREMWWEHNGTCKSYYCKYFNGNEEWGKYNNDKLIYEKKLKLRKKYDNEMIYTEKWYSYDETGKLINIKKIKHIEKWFD